MLTFDVNKQDHTHTPHSATISVFLFVKSFRVKTTSPARLAVLYIKMTHTLHMLSHDSLLPEADWLLGDGAPLNTSWGTLADMNTG